VVPSGTWEGKAGKSNSIKIFNAGKVFL